MYKSRVRVQCKSHVSQYPSHGQYCPAIAGHCVDEESCAVRRNKPSVHLATDCMELRAIFQPGTWESMGCCHLLGRRFAAALLPRLFGNYRRPHHRGATGRVRTRDQRLPILCHCQLGQDKTSLIMKLFNYSQLHKWQSME